MMTITTTFETNKDALQQYVTTGIQPNGFLTAMLENNFTEACLRADPDNAKLLKEYALYMLWELPPICWGSEQIVSNYITMKGN